MKLAVNMWFITCHFRWRWLQTYDLLLIILDEDGYGHVIYYLSHQMKIVIDYLFIAAAYLYGCETIEDVYQDVIIMCTISNNTWSSFIHSVIFVLYCLIIAFFYQAMYHMFHSCNTLAHSKSECNKNFWYVFDFVWISDVMSEFESSVFMFLHEEVGAHTNLSVYISLDVFITILGVHTNSGVHY